MISSISTNSFLFTICEDTEYHTYEQETEIMSDSDFGDIESRLKDFE